MVARFAGRDPEVAGKPEPPLFQETLRRVGGERPLVVGDRLDTDIEGANRVGYDSLLVMTGVTDLAALAAAPSGLRPTYVATDLGGLGRAHPEPERVGDAIRAGGWQASVSDGKLSVEGDPDASGDPSPDAWWRVAAVAAWSHLDEHGSAADVSGVHVPGSVSG